MIDMDTWPIKVAANVLGGLFLILIGCLLGHIYISRKYLGQLMAALSRSLEAEWWERRMNQGVLNKMLLFSILAQLVCMPGRHIREGDVSLQDIQEFPSDLKRVILIDRILTWVSVVALVVMCVLVEFRSGT
jgi:Gpi18-like mannosyltransferase